MAESAHSIPWGRLGSPYDIGKAAVMLCSDNANYITGSALKVDGGFQVGMGLPHMFKRAETKAKL